jgi:ABC-type multidrug transport system fused ATPase/permease subunit
MMALYRKAWGMLEPRQQRSAVALAFLMTIGMLLEMLGVGLLLPALTVLSGGVAENSPAFSALKRWLGHPTTAQLIAIGLVALFLLYLLKTAFGVLLAWAQARFVVTVQTSVSRRLFETFLYQPWTFHLQRNSASMIHAAGEEAAGFTNTLSTMLAFTTDGLITAGIIVILLVIEPVGAIGVAAILGLATWAFLAVSQRRITSWGRRRLIHDIARTKHLQQGLSGVKEVKLAGREAQFIDSFRKEAAAAAQLQGRVMVAQQMPRLWYELMAVAGLTTLGGGLALQGAATSTLVAKLGLFAVAAFRVLPSVNRMMLAWQALRFSDATIESLAEELALPSVSPAPSPARRLEFHRQICLDGVTFRYPGARQPALEGISMVVRRGQAIGIIGSSGAGKSTLVDILLGLLPPDDGRVTVDDHDIRMNLRAWQQCIGYVPQSIYLMDDSIRANVAFGVAPHEIDDEALARALAAAHLADFVDNLPQKDQTVVGERGVRLSGGQRQRIGIARALYHDPPVLVLDEATSALDSTTEQGVMAAVNQLHGAKTLVIIAHRLSTVADCDSLVKLERGRVVGVGNYDEVVS